MNSYPSFRLRSVVLLSALIATIGIAARPSGRHIQPTNSLANVEILIVRHGEKPSEGAELTPAGQARANAYVNYFKNLKLNGRAIHLTHLVATKDSKGSMRERLTLEPLSKAIGLPLDLRFSNKKYDELAQDLQAHSYGKEILICWHHGNIPALITALGGDGAKLFPGGKWPSDRFDLLVDLQFDGQGKLTPQYEKLYHERLMPGDK